MDSAAAKPAAARASSNSSSNRTTCATCHRRKVKCDAHDAGFPCSRCRKGGQPDQCRLHLKGKRVSRARRTTTHHAAHPIVVAPAANAGGDSQTPIGLSSVVGGDDSSLPRGSSPPHEAAATPTDATRAADTTGSRTPPPQPDVDLMHLHIDDALRHGEYKRYLVEFIDQPLSTQRPIDRNARIMYTGSGLSNVSYLLRWRRRFGGGDDGGMSGVSHYATNRIPRRHTCHEPDRLPVEAFHLPSRPVVDELLDAYFQHVNTAFPVVDADLFLRQYRARDPDDPPSLLLLQSLLVAGAHVHYDDPARRHAHKSAFFRRAKMLFDARFERNRDVVVQAALLLAWHSDGPEDVAANAWFWIGVAARTALGLGMHRDAEASTLVPHNKRMWRRVWWLLFQSDVLLSLQYGRPQALRLADANVQKLKLSDFRDCGPSVRADYVMWCTELCLILSDVLRHQFDGAPSPAEPAAAQVRRQLDKRLADWSARLPRSLHLVPGSPTGCVCTAVLHMHYNTAVILLHRAQPQPQPRRLSGCIQPGQGGGSDTPGGGGLEDAGLCATAAMTIQQIFQLLHERDQLRFLWCATVNCLFTALIQLSIDVRITNPILAVASLQRYEAALAALRSLADYWPNAQAIVQFFEESVRPGGRPRPPEIDSQAEPLGPAVVSPLSPVAPATCSRGPQDDCPRAAASPSSVSSSRSPVALGDWALPLTVIGEGLGPSSMDPSTVSGSWSSHWQQFCWNHPGSTDDILFSF
ncbi:hypothetical protein VTK73DRAFT_7807 [Phialemonium thermophilum]|uniref:Zn(2)-C6 fungal-type domain-containing protein n=1 Tax=Phialemonium thermophilum TaxID=223376 RepID=A0ABR3WCK4_9PEZI